MFDVIVLGGGPAGVAAALRARELGATVALVERDRLGGVCTNDGCVPTRVLAKAARLVRDTEQFGDYGLSGARPTVAAVMNRPMARTMTSGPRRCSSGLVAGRRIPLSLADRPRVVCTAHPGGDCCDARR